MSELPQSVPAPRRLPAMPPAAIAATALVGTALVMAVLAEVIAPYDPNKQNYTAILQGPSLEHLLGTDQLGRDMLSRLIYGTRVAMTVAVAAVGTAVVFGSILGLVAGYMRGLVDEAIMRLVDAVLAFPSIMLALGIMAALGPSLSTIIIAIAIGDMPIFARLVRGQVLSIRERDFVTAAVVMGARPVRIIWRHIWPHVIGPTVALATLHVGLAILTEASLSFLGLGVQPPTASWGSILRAGFGYIEIAPWISVFSGVFIFLTVFGACLMGDVLREKYDPRAAGGAL